MAAWRGSILAVAVLAACSGGKSAGGGDEDEGGLAFVDTWQPPPADASGHPDLSDERSDVSDLSDALDASDATDASDLPGAPDAADAPDSAGPPDSSVPDAKPLDSDGDGLPDEQEKQLGTNPYSADSDKDGLNDGDELAHGCDPLKQDTDYDGLTDKKEVELGTDPKAADTDGDGLKDGKEVDLGTDPFAADTDGDGLKDGEELAALSDPLKPDTDGDGLSDLEEVTLYGTNPASADSDNDGLSDPVELTDGSNPMKADSDGDGLKDPKEKELGTDPNKPDSDADGLNDKKELDLKTSPTNPDTDGDGLTDGWEVDHGLPPLNPDVDGDGLSDGDEVNVWGTDPQSQDTDGDGLTDLDEVQLGTDPKLLDTDGDGADDGTEIALGLDPGLQDSDGDGVSDGQEPLFVTCGQFNLEVPNYLDNGVAGFTLAVQKETLVTQLLLPDVSMTAATMDYAVDAVEIAAAAVSYLPADGNTDVDAISTQVAAKFAGICSTTIRSSGYKKKSWDGQFDLKVLVVLDAECGGAATVGSVRNDAVKTLTGLPDADLGGLPAPMGQPSGQLVITYLVESREMARQVIIAAVASRSAFDDLADPTRLIANDFVNGSNLANYLNGTDDDCSPFVGKTAKADFIWSVDNSGSMDDDQKTVAANVPKFTSLLANAGMDYRLAVTYQTCSNLDTASGQAGLSAEIVSLIRQDEIANDDDICSASASSPGPVNGNLCNKHFMTDLGEFSSCVLAGFDGGGHEYTLSTGMMAIDRSLPREDNNVTKLRTDATTILVVLTDEHEQAFEYELDWLGNETPTDPQQISQLKKVTDPYIAWLSKPEINALVFGLIVMPDMGDSEAAVGIYRVVNERGGTAGHLPSGNLEATLKEIIAAAIGMSSTAKFEHVPISMTIQVSVAKAGSPAVEVPRSRQDGYEYDSLSNGLVFHGSYVPKTGDEIAVSYLYWM